MNQVARILPDLNQRATNVGTDLMAELEALRAENARLKAAKGGLMKVTEKGGVAVYGLGRFPVTLYRSQWESLNARMAEVMAFIEANAERLASKPGKD